MRNVRTLAVGLILAILIAACGSNAGGSTGPGGDSSTEPSAEASTGGGGGGSGPGFGDGKATFELTGVRTKSGELGYLKGLGLIDSDGQQVAMTFVNDDSTGSLTINSGPTGSVVLYADSELGATLLPIGTVIGECRVDFSTLEKDHAKGTFHCEHIAIVENGGQSVAGEGTLTGSFEARN